MENTAIITQEERLPIREEMSLSEWMFERIKPFVGGKVLEVDTGNGHMAGFCRQRGIQTEVLPINLADETFTITYANLSAAFDMVITLHIIHDVIRRKQAITNSVSLLKKEGLLVIQLPLQTALYEGLDEGLEKWRWNNRQFMTNQLQVNFNIIKIGYCLVTDTAPYISQNSINYRDKINVFSSNMATGFDQAGLYAIVIGQRI